MFCCVTRNRNWSWLKTKYVSAHERGLHLVLCIGGAFALGLSVGHYAAGDWRVRIYVGKWCWTWVSPVKGGGK